MIRGVTQGTDQWQVTHHACTANPTRQVASPRLSHHPSSTSVLSLLLVLCRASQTACVQLCRRARHTGSSSARALVAHKPRARRAHSPFHGLPCHESIGTRRTKFSSSSSRRPGCSRSRLGCPVAGPPHLAPLRNRRWWRRTQCARSLLCVCGRRLTAATSSPLAASCYSLATSTLTTLWYVRRVSAHRPRPRVAKMRVAAWHPKSLTLPTKPPTTERLHGPWSGRPAWVQEPRAPAAWRWRQRPRLCPGGEC